MTDYKAMYLPLYNKVTDVIELLQKAQQEAEITFMEQDSDVVVNLPLPYAHKCWQALMDIKTLINNSTINELTCILMIGKIISIFDDLDIPITRYNFKS